MHHFNGSCVCPWLLVRSQHYAAITLVSLDHVFITLQRQPMPVQQSSPSRWPLAAPPSAVCCPDLPTVDVS